MLHPDDAKVVELDPELPALREILDNDSAGALFAKHVPGLQPIAVRCTYLRYKPHTSCLAAFTVDTGDGKKAFHTTAYGIDARDKWAKVDRANRSRDTRCPRPIVVPELGIVISKFPCDLGLPSLERISTPGGQVQLLSRLFREDDNELLSAEWTTLRYKPERRFVSRLDVGDSPRAVLKLHSEQVYAQSRRAAKSLGSLTEINTARPLGHSDRHRAVLLQWLPGGSLESLLSKSQLPANTMGEVGRLLARLHKQQTSKLPHHTAAGEAQEILRSAEDLGAIFPSIKGLLGEISQKCAAQLAQLPPVVVPIHGDCHPQQIIVTQANVSIIDLDSAALGHPAGDLGNFLAHLEREVLLGRIPRELGNQLSEELLAGYSENSGTVDRQAVRTFRAMGLLRLAHEPFRYRHTNWHGETANLVERASSVLAEIGQRPNTLFQSGKRFKNVKNTPPSAKVTDPLSASNDCKLPHVATAISPSFACQTIVPIIRQTFEDESLRLRSIRVLRHKPGRRCLIQYSCASDRGNRDVIVLGKIHAKSKHERSYRLQQTLWESDFHYDSKDGISVARPVGTVPECQMWLQEWVAGISGWEALSRPSQGATAVQIAAAAHKLHQADILTKQSHSIDDELQILAEKLPLVAPHSSQLKSRLSDVLSACKELAASIPSSEPKGIHRDFYPDQIVIDQDRLYVFDHDLYCMGNPGLDVGNFCGHLVEHSLRIHGHPHVYAKVQTELCDRFNSLQQGSCLSAVDAYTSLTLVRHIFLSTQFANRCSKTLLILDHCERALALSK